MPTIEDIHFADALRSELQELRETLEALVHMVELTEESITDDAPDFAAEQLLRALAKINEKVDNAGEYTAILPMDVRDAFYMFNSL